MKMLGYGLKRTLAIAMVICFMFSFMVVVQAANELPTIVLGVVKTSTEEGATWETADDAEGTVNEGELVFVRATITNGDGTGAYGTGEIPDVTLLVGVEGTSSGEMATINAGNANDVIQFIDQKSAPSATGPYVVDFQFKFRAGESNPSAAAAGNYIIMVGGTNIDNPGASAKTTIEYVEAEVDETTPPTVKDNEEVVEYPTATTVVLELEDCDDKWIAAIDEVKVWDAEEDTIADAMVLVENTDYTLTASGEKRDLTIDLTGTNAADLIPLVEGEEIEWTIVITNSSYDSTESATFSVKLKETGGGDDNIGTDTKTDLLAALNGVTLNKNTFQTVAGDATDDVTLATKAGEYDITWEYLDGTYKGIDQLPTTYFNQGTNKLTFKDTNVTGSLVSYDIAAKITGNKGKENTFDLRKTFTIFVLHTAYVPVQGDTTGSGSLDTTDVNNALEVVAGLKPVETIVGGRDTLDLNEDTVVVLREVDILRRVQSTSITWAKAEKLIRKLPIYNAAP